jgi:hypothetical protein
MRMDSPPTSRLSFIASDGTVLSGPSEWSACLLVVDADPGTWQSVELSINGRPQPLSLRSIRSQAQIVAEWPRSGTGGYLLEATGRSWSEQQTVRIGPQKITEPAYAALLDDLQSTLPATIAIALQRGGALAGVDVIEPRQSTLAEELERLRRAIFGTESRAGLIAILQSLAEQPHQVLRSVEVWTRRERARRIHPTSLYRAYARAGNVDVRHLPIAVLDQRVEHTVDVYENRVLRSFHDQVARRLRRAANAAERSRSPDLSAEATGMVRALARARRTAGFLDEVSELHERATRVTMVLLKRGEYRSALEGLLEFNRSALVRLDETLLESPLTNLPSLYEKWGTLTVIAASLRATTETGFRVIWERITRRVPGELWIQVLPTGEPAVRLLDPSTGRRVSVIPQRTYGRNPHELHSISFAQIPDVAIEIRDRAHSEVLIFDPKYKLDSEQTVEEARARPKKADIDAMHAYRDAIRDPDGRAAVRYAAILYPGPTVTYAPYLQAIEADPLDREALERHVSRVVGDALAQLATGI